MVLNEIASETLIVYKAWGNTSWEFKIDLLSKHYLWSPLGKLYDAGVIPLGLPSRRIKVISSGGSGRVPVVRLHGAGSHVRGVLAGI